MPILLLATIAVSWAAITVIVIAACMTASSADRAEAEDGQPTGPQPSSLGTAAAPTSAPA